MLQAARICATLVCRPCSAIPLSSIRARVYSTGQLVDPQHEHLFKYTSGRWVHNETDELAKRYHRFNVDALKMVAAKAGGASSVTSIKKQAEDEFHKSFVLTLNNGKEVIARLPTSNAGPSHIVTASEVATIEFVRSHLHIPTPRVLAWSSDKSSNLVESDYIITEQPKGLRLDQVWRNMPLDLRPWVIAELAKVENVFKKAVGGGYGSIYFRNDVENGKFRDLIVDGVREEKFVLGPATSTSFWSDQKAEMDSLDRGPWDSTLSYILAVAKRERDWIENYAVWNEYPGPFDPPMLKQSPEAHIALLNKLIAVGPHIIPKDVDLLKPTLRHRDFTIDARSIFISEKHFSEGEIKITDIVDWQHASIMPIYLARRLSAPPEPPLTIPSVDFPTQSLLANPLMFGGTTWPKHFIAFRESLFELVKNWDELATGVPCPIEFSDDEWKERESDLQEWKRYEDMVAMTDSVIGVSGGRVSAEGYDAAVEKNKAYMDAYIEEFKKEAPGEALAIESFVPTFWLYRPWES